MEKAKFLWAKSDLVKSVGMVWLPSEKANLVWFSLVTFMVWLPSAVAKFSSVRFGLVNFCKGEVLPSLVNLCSGQVGFC